MDRNDYLEILHDYLEDGLSLLEINDILRKYEEIFVRNKLEGISDEKTIAKLGSPKYIAAKEILDKKGENKADDKTINNGLNKKIQRLAKRINSKASTKIRKKHRKKNSILSAEAIVSGRVSERKVRKILKFSAVLSWIICIPAVFLIAILAVFLVGFSLTNIIAFAGAFYLFSYRLSLGFFTMFVSITWAGVSIILCVIYIIMLKGIISVFVKYLSWRRDKKSYLKIREEYSSTKSSEFVDGVLIKDYDESSAGDGGDDDEK